MKDKGVGKKMRIQKSALIAIGAILIVVVAVLGYSLGTRTVPGENGPGSSGNTIVENSAGGAVNTNGRTNATAQNVNAAPSLTYERLSDPALTVSFESVKEWTRVAPEEVMKSVTEEQLSGYRIVHYATTGDGAVLSVSQKPFPTGGKTVATIVNDDNATADRQNATFRVVRSDIQRDFARQETTFEANGTSYTVISKSVLNAGGTEGRDWYTILEVVMPTGLRTKYEGVAERLISALATIPGT